MSNEEIIRSIEGHEHEIGSLKHRMNEVEDQGKVLNDLAFSVKELALNMKNMMEEQKKAAERLSKLENEPAQRWNETKKTAFTAIVSTIAGALAAGLIGLIAQFI